MFGCTIRPNIPTQLSTLGTDQLSGPNTFHQPEELTAHRDRKRTLKGVWLVIGGHREVPVVSGVMEELEMGVTRQKTVTRSSIIVFALIMVALAGGAYAQPNTDPATVERANAGDAGLWTLRSKHLIWGMPRQSDNRHNVGFPGETTARSGLSVLVREGFVIGHYDLFKVPAWVAVRWTREDHDNLLPGSFGRDFGPDPELPQYARAGDDYEFSTSNMERDHMARHEDNEAWGEDNSDSGCLMSNIVPQHRDINGEAWNDLEELHQDVVADLTVAIDTVWVISEPIYEDTDGDGDEDPVDMIGNDVAVPQATYKVIGWFDGNDVFHARGYVVRQEDRVRNNPAHYLRRIDDIESVTGLDFFPELPTNRVNAIESVVHTDLWGNGDGPEGDSGGQVLIASLLPNPVGNENQNEAVTVRNTGTGTVSLNGWRLRDRANRTWALFGTLDAGDEQTFTRDGQPMALNNNGDTVDLIDEGGTVVGSVTYQAAQEGQVLNASHLR